MKKPKTATSAPPEVEQQEQRPRQEFEATHRDAVRMRRSMRHTAMPVGMLTSRRQRSRMRFKRPPSSTVAAGQHRLGAVVRVRKRVRRVSPPHRTAFGRFLRDFLYHFLHAFLLRRHTREQALRPREGGSTGTPPQPERHSRPEQKPATVRRTRRHMSPAQAMRTHTAPQHGDRRRGGRRGQSRGQPAADTPSHGTTASAGTGALPAVLVVDDDPPLRRLLLELFTLEGRTVYLAEHGGPALQRLRASAESMVVLLGLLMPQVDGEAVLEALAADTILARRHAFVMVTAAIPLAFGGRVAELRRLLGIPLIAKPFTVNELLQVVDDATRRLTSGPPLSD